MKQILIALFVMLNMHLFAAPWNGQTKSFKQPDGTSVNVKLFGTEYYMRAESMDGYTLIRDAETEWICYAQLSEDKSTLISTNVHYTGSAFPISAFTKTIPQKGIDISMEAKQKLIDKRKFQLHGNRTNSSTKTIYYPVSGNIKGLCLLVDFSDEPATIPISEFIAFCNDLNYSNYGNNGSLRKYYSDVSGGVVDYENIVYGYYRASQTFADYEMMQFGYGAQEVLGEALQWLDNQGFDFSTLTTNPDGSITAINLMYTGEAQNWSQGMWWHMGNYTGFSADGVYSSAYNCSPANEPLNVSVVAHENGHMLGKWPDTYKYTSDNGPDGIGTFDLMCNYGDAMNPVPPNPHFVNNAGWGKMVDITSFNGLITDTANSLTSYKFINVNDTNEFFLLQSRMRTGRSAAISDEGLTIWHIDRNGDNQTMHHEVWLEPADDNIWDQDNACFHSGGNVLFDMASTPNSKFYNNDPSGLRVWDISPKGNIMTYRIGNSTTQPNFILEYLTLNNDDNGNGFIEPGETAEIHVNATNTGGVASSSTTHFSCIAIGANSSYVTIVSNPLSLGSMAPLNATACVQQISLSPLMPLGTIFQIKFLIDDGTYSHYITKNFIAGMVINMNNSQISTCSSMFYDYGGLESNYSNNLDHILTITPNEANRLIKVQFNSFALEFENNCIYDYLSIYDGDNTSSDLIGTYCGSDNPGTITSSHSTGSLTFLFHSDVGLSDLGWEAIVTCENLSVMESQPYFNCKVYPNPTNEILTINSNDEIRWIKLFNVLGDCVYISEPDTSHFNINVSSLPKGVYSISLESNFGEIISQRIIIQ